MTVRKPLSTVRRKHLEEAFKLLPSEFGGREVCLRLIEHEVSLFESRTESPHWVPTHAIKELQELRDASEKLGSVLRLYREAKPESLGLATLLLELEEQKFSFELFEDHLSRFWSAAGGCQSLFRVKDSRESEYLVKSKVLVDKDWQEHEKKVERKIRIAVTRAEQRAKVKTRPQRADDLHVKRLVFQAVSIYKTATGKMPTKYRPAPLDERRRPVKSKSYFFVKECLAAAGKKKPDDLYPFIDFAVDALTQIKRGCQHICWALPLSSAPVENQCNFGAESSLK